MFQDYINSKKGSIVASKSKEKNLPTTTQSTGKEDYLSTQFTNKICSKTKEVSRIDDIDEETYQLEEEDLMQLFSEFQQENLDINALPKKDFQNKPSLPKDRINEYFTVTDVVSHSCSCKEIKCLPKIYNSQEEEQTTYGISKSVLLFGMWTEVIVDQGDSVYISAHFSLNDNAYIIADSNYSSKINKIYTNSLEIIQDFLILEPEILISPSRIKLAYPCLRRSLINEEFKIIVGQTYNKELLIGSIIHEVFESTIKLCSNLHNDPISKEMIEEKIKNVMKNYYLDMALYNLLPEDIMKSTISYVSNIIKFFRDFFVHRYSLNGLTFQNFSASEKVCQSQVLGMKGIIDMLVVTQNEQKQAEITPVELKTGNTQSNGDVMQVLVYCLILSEHLASKSLNGVLVYLKRDSTLRIKVNTNDIISVIVTRNNLAKQIIRLDSSSENFLSLPKLASPNECLRCFSKDICFFHYANYENPQEMTRLNQSNQENLIERDFSPYIKDEDTRIYFNYFYKIINEEESYSYNLEKTSIKDGQAYDLSEYKKFKIMSVEDKDNSYNLNLVSEEYLLKENQDNEQEGDSATANHYVYTNDKYHVYEPNWRRSFPGVLINKSDMIGASMFTLNVLKSYTNKYKSQPSIFADSSVTHLYLKNVNATSKYPFKLMRGNLISLCLDKNPKLRELVINHVPTSIDFEQKTYITLMITKHYAQDFQRLNYNQKAALMMALLCKDYTLIIGFPGSGKTTLIALLIDILVKMKKKVLVSAHTNTAVDNILVKLKERKINFIRISSREETVHHSVRPHLVKNLDARSYEDWKKVLENNYVYGSTTLGVNNKILMSIKFDVCLLDEACQILEPSLIGPLLLSKRFILVGDPFQLPALLRSNDSPPPSLFERLCGKNKQCSIQLNFQYRMNGDILTLSNACVYQNTIKCANSEVEARKLNIITENLYNQPKWVSQILSPQRSVIFTDYSKWLMENQPQFLIDCQDSNEIEANIIKQLIMALKYLDFDLSTVGIITPYKAQESLLLNILSEIDFFNVYTIDKSQGLEKEIIIISFVKTNNKTKILRDIARINVAFTRPRSKLIIVGLMEYLIIIERLKEYMNLILQKGWFYEFESI